MRWFLHNSISSARLPWVGASTGWRCPATLFSWLPLFSAQARTVVSSDDLCDGMKLDPPTRGLHRGSYSVTTWNFHFYL